MPSSGSAAGSVRNSGSSRPPSCAGSRNRSCCTTPVWSRRPSHGPTRPAATIVNPFKGLHAFREADADDFFGRDRLVADVVARVGDGARLVALVGPSGSGKSSVVRAGVVPALRKGAVAGL